MKVLDYGLAKALEGDTIHASRPNRLTSTSLVIEVRLATSGMLSLEDGEERALTNFEGRHGRLANDVFTTGGEFLYFGWHESTGDIWVMDVVTDENE